MKPLITLTVAILSAAIGAAAHAQTVKKYVTPEGKTIYSDQPVPGAKEVGEVAPPPPVDSAAREAAEGSARRDAKALERTGTKAEDARRARIEAAQAELEKARRALKEGAEPLPGERTGTATGGSRLTEAYHERQKANQLAVERAQRNLDEARAAQ